MTSASDAMAATVMTALVAYMFLFLIYFVPIVISTWLLYKNAGKPGWASLIPVYNTMVMAEIGEKPVWMGVLGGLATVSTWLRNFGLLLALIGIIPAFIVLAAFFKKYQWGLGKQILYIFVPIVFVFMAKNVHYKGGNGTPGTLVEATPALAPQQPAQQAQAYQPASGNVFTQNQ